MKNPFRTRYRICGDNYAGYEAQFRYWWMPFYMQIGFVNTYFTEEAAEEFIRRRKVIKQVEL